MLRVVWVVELSWVGIGDLSKLELSEIVSRLKSASRNVGCVVLFIGFVREEGLMGDKVKHLHYESYGDLAIKKMEEIRKGVIDGEKVFSAIIHHAVGRVPVGEETLIVGVAAKHRAEGFKAVQEIIDKVKSEVPIWKKEVTDEGEYWIHEVEKVN
ncbi:MAG: molybdenum cofactor biosynthesis protein MoaE [Candidatus Methanomethylicota archaeon]|uniref:Molybdenum cofactor biosynthesis protein MoaE n=1 Tax=Thermoproteota archaeon TaxID=2056631 RepID=A0A497EUQ4_9CREN|nr:MAG: molybdenum cofactor biosynthesis protein MoaE [Candidatus Verstraetearchaeota archaeon]RLE55336.1 MAG: molybdenum cofactor biosynthesis protein MoaE [Candidatus Verstraetearchaeota archaeon]